MQSTPTADAASATDGAEGLHQLSDGELEGALVQAQRDINAAEARRSDVVNELARRSRAADFAEAPSHRREEFVADHVATLLTCTKAVAGGLLDTALESADHASLMREWRSGLIDSRKVGVIANSLRHCDRAFADSIAAQAIEYGRTRTAPQLRVWLDRRLLAADASLATIRRRQAVGERRVTLTPLADGMAELAAYLPAAQARQIYDTVHAIAMSAGSDDRRSMDQRRADGFVDVVVGRAEPPRVNVNVVVTAETLLESDGEPGWVAGVGPVTADEARMLVLTEGTAWRKLMADPDSGVLTGVAEHRYRPTAKLDRAVRARDVTCRFPGCRRSATSKTAGTDLDHTVAWPEGETSAANLAVLCRHHHRLKHSPGWQVTSDGNGTMTWVTPGGRTIITTPWEYLDRPPHPPD